MAEPWPKASGPLAAGTRFIILCKPPQRGACKTRLAASLGPERAARLARAFLVDTWASVSSYVSAREDLDLVLAQSHGSERFPLLLPAPTIVRQGEGDLGRRMATLAAGGLGQRDRALLLGTDSPDLPEGHLDAALHALDDADVVVGPCRDGGFWCLGVRGGHQALWGNMWLDGIEWNSDTTCKQVEARVQRMGAHMERAPEWYDVDRMADLERLRTELHGEADQAPETLRELERLDEPDPVSVIVPSLDENVGLDDCLEALDRLDGPLEIIVADGGSTDRSPERATAAGAVVVQSPPGRGRQLAAGAAMATGPVLLFVHVDTRLPASAIELITEALHNGQAEAGAFVTHTVRDPRYRNLAGPLLRLADIRSRITRHPYGDQALFVTRAAYEDVGGYRPLPVMEDYDLSIRLARRKPLARIATPVEVSGRRIQTRPLRSVLLMRLLPPLFRMGVSPELLARLYRPW